MSPSSLTAFLACVIATSPFAGSSAPQAWMMRFGWRFHIACTYSLVTGGVLIVIREFTDAGVEALLVSLALESTIKTPRVTNEYVHAVWKRHPKHIIQAWGALEPAKGEVAMTQARKAVRELGLIGFHFHPIMQHFAVNDSRY